MFKGQACWRLCSKTKHAVFKMSAHGNFNVIQNLAMFCLFVYKCVRMVKYDVINKKVEKFEIKEKIFQHDCPFEKALTIWAILSFEKTLAIILKNNAICI